MTVESRGGPAGTAPKPVTDASQMCMQSLISPRRVPSNHTRPFIYLSPCTHTKHIHIQCMGSYKSISMAIYSKATDQARSHDLPVACMFHASSNLKATYTSMHCDRMDIIMTWVLNLLSMLHVSKVKLDMTWENKYSVPNQDPHLPVKGH